MNLNTIIFSSDTKYRIARHAVFWVCWFLLKVAASSVGISHASGEISKIVMADVLVSVQSIIAQVPFCYFVLYFVIPRFILRKKYLTGFAMLLASLAAFTWLDYVVTSHTSAIVRSSLNLTEPPPPIDFKFIFILHMVSSTGVLVGCSLMCALKFLKFWYVKQQENVLLLRENVVAELQLLKAQVHPHFLFNTLNNIYSFTLIKSPVAESLLEKLSGILRYMILEGQDSRVPLKKEIQLIEDYISLEKVRYGDRLDIHLDIQGSMDNKLIAPLLMIPFVENSFKHGSSKMLKNPKVELTIAMKDDELMFTLTNNKPATDTQEISANGKGGIGLKNVAKRLQLLYPGSHNLIIESADTTFSVKLSIKYKEMTDPLHDNVAHPSILETAAYADQ